MATGNKWEMAEMATFPACRVSPELFTPQAWAVQAKNSETTIKSPGYPRSSQVYKKPDTHLERRRVQANSIVWWTSSRFLAGENELDSRLSRE
ncbi:hypothetical protein AGMMS50256_06010 [Betaproteobacteria bacterium]|nr:hypothetical protein AGMMS50256_06010 [Betaproteobacteria bacterium]